MIIRLEISNYAIIEHIALDFAERMNVITGETGSGKSIILGAFRLILGDRADRKSLYNKSKKCIVEATFDTRQYELADFFERENLDFEEEVIIRREISASGKSRAFINDTPVNLKQLQQLTSQLVDLHRQFASLDLNYHDAQMGMLDALADNQTLLSEYRNHFQQFQKLRLHLDELRERHQNAIKQRDFIQFQFDELQEIDLNLGRDQELERTLQQMEHAKDIIRVLGNLSYSLQDNEQSIISTISGLQVHLQEIAHYHPASGELDQRLQSCRLELEDIANEARKISDGLEIDGEGMDNARERLDRLNQLLHKHQVTDLSALADLMQEFERELGSYQNLEEEMIDTEKSMDLAMDKAEIVASNLRQKRQKSIPVFNERVNDLLKALKMEHADFQISLDASEKLHKLGRDKIDFLFTANKGSAHRSIKDVASGGELSRLSLITKSIVAGSLQLPTLIFDEIDSGVSGDVAQKMGNILQELSQNHQVINITHSPQVAARAHRHFKVYKELEKEMTKTKIETLSGEQRIIEIATMLSSSPPSTHALESAKELMSNN